MCRTIITNGTIVNDGEHFIGSIIVKGEFIESVIKGKLPEISYTTQTVSSTPRANGFSPELSTTKYISESRDSLIKPRSPPNRLQRSQEESPPLWKCPIPFPKRRPSKPLNGNTLVQPKFPRRTILFISALPTIISRY